MLTLKVQGEEHPKTFVLVTDDTDGELARLKEILGEVDAGPGSPEYDWFEGHSADQFAEGVAIPQDFMADFVELLEGDWPEAYETFEKERRDAMEKAEAALGGDED